MILGLLLTASASVSSQLDEGRRLLRSSRAEISALIASDPSIALLHRSVIMSQTSDAGQLWSACVRGKVIDQTASSNAAAAIADAALASCDSDREEFQNWLRVAAQANGESPIEPDIEAIVSKLRALIRGKAIEQIRIDRQPKRR